MEGTCKECDHKLRQGPHQLCRCKMTGLEIADPQDTCLAWTKKESPSGAVTPDEEQSNNIGDIIP